MKRLSRILTAVACALGMSAAEAQSVQRGDKVASTGQATPTVAQASSAAPIQTAQAGAAAGGASGGASTGGVFAGVGTAGSVGSTVVFVGSAVAGAAAASTGGSTVTH